MKSFLAKVLRRGLLPLLPARWHLPFTLWLYLRREDAEPELRHLAKLVPARGVAIDVGANMGLFALSLARRCDKVYAFEINPQTVQMLKDCARPNVEIFTVGLSNIEGEATLYTPVQQDGLALRGWASLQPGNCPGVTQHEERRVSLRRLDSFQFSKCDFLKIDVEGHEVEVLQGARETLRRTRPVILVEVREQNSALVNACLEPLGYRRADFRELAGIPGGDGNALFLPG